jgi:GDP-L-fucose synthase
MMIDSKILITGSRGMVGSSLVDILKSLGYNNILIPSSKELNLINQQDTADYFKANKPEYCFHIAGKVGGIYANMTYRADFIYQNLMMAANVIHCCHTHNIKKIIFVSSGCVYPDSAPNPIKETSLLTDLLQQSHEHYAISKIAGIKMCEAYNLQYGLNYAVAVPNNIYGPRDNYHPQNSHVMAALIGKFHNAKINNLSSVEIWGSGNQKREFVYVDDLSRALIELMLNPNAKGIYNCGGGENIKIRDLSNKIAKVVGFTGELTFNTDKPEGHLEKYFDCTKLRALGWSPQVNLDEGIEKAYQWYKSL